MKESGKSNLFGGGTVILTNGVVAAIVGSQLIRDGSFFLNALGVFLLITGAQVLLWLIGFRVEFIGTVEEFTRKLSFPVRRGVKKDGSTLEVPLNLNEEHPDKSPSPDLAQRFVQSETRYKLNRSYLGMAMAAILGIIGILQTQLFVSQLPQPSIDDIRHHMVASRAIQGGLHDRYRGKTGGEAPRGIVFDSSLFGEKQLEIMKRSMGSIFDDEQLQRELKRKFGTSFQDIDAVVVPAWQTASYNDEMIGITAKGGLMARRATGESNIAGFTLRDRVREIPVTIDGTPRIILNSSAFESERILRLTLFHELLHAMNVPGVQSSSLTFAPDDLMYLPEYRSFVNRNGFGFWREFLIWSLAVFLPWLICFLIGLHLLKTRRTVLKTQPRSRRSGGL